MREIFQSENFAVIAAQEPHIDRKDGGHIIIIPHKKVKDRQKLTPKQAIELMRLTIVVGQAMKKVMNAHEVDVERINYQDNGNWSVFKPEGPYLHIHLYGRAKSAKIQRYGQSLSFPHKEEHPEYYANLQPLTAKDLKALKDEIVAIFKEEKFADKNWGLI